MRAVVVVLPAYAGMILADVVQRSNFAEVLPAYAGMILSYLGEIGRAHV